MQIDEGVTSLCEARFGKAMCDFRCKQQDSKVVRRGLLVSRDCWNEPAAPGGPLVPASAMLSLERSDGRAGGPFRVASVSEAASGAALAGMQFIV